MIERNADFCVSPAGIAGTYTKAFQQVLEALQGENPQQFFLEMTESEDIGKALYGLAGLRLLGSELYSGVRDHLKTRNDTVMLGTGGCMFRASTINKAIDYLERELEPR